MTATNSPIGKPVAASAFAAAAAALLGLIAVGAWLRGGLPFAGADAAERAAYVLRHQKCWTWGWLLAGFGAVMVVNLYRALAARWEGRCGACCRFAMLLATSGLAVDLSGIALWMMVSPGLSGDSFALVERMAAAFSLFVAKILYSAAGILLTLAGRKELPGKLTLLAFAVWVSGLCVAAFTLCGCERAQFWSLGALAVLFIAWATLLGFHFLGRAADGTTAAHRSFSPDPRD